MGPLLDAIISIKPRYAEAILSGTKRVELRRRIPPTPVGTRLWIYSTMPVGAIVGTAIVEEIVRAPPSDIWHRYKAVAGIDEELFHEYFAGSLTAIAMVLRGAQRQEPILIDSLRRELGSFHPPQVLAKLPAARMKSLQSLTSVG